MKFLYVALGAGLGGGLRYWISSLAARTLPLFFPFGTLIVNVAGSLLLGFLIFGMDEKEMLSPTLRLLLGVGFCGGFTTFSTFSVETIHLLRQSEYMIAALYIFLNVFLSIAAALAGYLIPRYWL